MYIVANMKTKYTEYQKEQARLIRESYIKSGECKAKNNEPLHIKACMLYWAEGSKMKNVFQFTNCDVTTHKIMMEFLRHYFPEQTKRLKVRVNYYPSPELSYDDIKNYWKKELGINDNQFNKATDRTKYYKSPTNNKYPYGILQLQLCSTEVIQHIFGGINTYVDDTIFNANTCIH
jgi:hypothetical protein